MDINSLYTKGFTILPIPNPSIMAELRAQVVAFSKKKLGQRIPNDFNKKNDNDFLNAFHSLGLNEGEVNDLRVALVNEFSVETKMNRRVFEMLATYLDDILGKDVAGQRKVNFSIQEPGSESIVPVHRDAPVNSNFEIVVWIPLVDVFDTKAMYLLDSEQSYQALQAGLDPENGYQKFVDFTLERAQHPSIKFGEVLFFHPNNIHGCKVNEIPETRWSINLRFRGLFKPFGKKNPLEFFETIQLSEYTKLALRAENFEINHSDCL